MRGIDEGVNDLEEADGEDFGDDFVWAVEQTRLAKVSGFASSILVGLRGICHNKTIEIQISMIKCME